jgi:hypothetical protein
MLGRCCVIFFFVLSCVALAACNRGRPRGGGVDSGVVVLDGGPRPDAPIVFPDAGRDASVPRDSSTAECGTGLPACPGGTTCIDGRCVVGPRECAEEIPYNVVAVCSSSTMTCISGCADGACITSCLEADPNPDCDACVNQNFISCANSNGCMASWVTYACCVEDVCGTAPTTTCVQSAATGACSSSSDAYDTCIMGVDIETFCSTFLQDCF